MEEALIFFKVEMECSHPENTAATAWMMLSFLMVVIMSNVLHPLTVRGSYPIPAFPGHTFCVTVTTRTVFLVHLAAVPACSLCLSGFRWKDFSPHLRAPACHQPQPFFALEEQLQVSVMSSEFASKS